MRLGTAIERLVDNYRYASDKDWIMDKVAWALYQTWKEADRNTDLQTETQTETQNSNLTFEKRTMRDCYNCKRYETEGECIECKFEPKTEPQTERSMAVGKRSDETADKYNLYGKTTTDEPQTERSSK